MDTNPLPIIGLAFIFAVGRRVVDLKPASSNLFFHRGVDTMHLGIVTRSYYASSARPVGIRLNILAEPFAGTSGFEPLMY
jgi:hypothetical protein